MSTSDDVTFQPDPSRPPLPSHLPKDGLIIIGAGLGRTGTESLQTALQILLNAPCYHMAEVFKHKESHLWCPKDGNVDLDRILNKRPDGIRYRACVDYPVCAYVPELMALYPNAIVLLSKRKSAEEWAASAESTIFRASKVFLILNMLTFGLLPFVANFVAMLTPMLARTLGFPANLSSLTHDNFVKGYEKHNAEIERIVPKERLLVYTTGDGWEPICKKLGLPIPTVAYPHKNRGENFMVRFWQILTKQIFTPKALLAIAVAGMAAAVYFRR